MKNNTEQGLSLIEILVVITIFAVLGVIISSSVILTIQGTKKTEALIRVRENVNYSLSVMDRNLKNANSITSCTDSQSIAYLDQYGRSSTFSCVGVGSDNAYIASGSSRLTASSTKIISCSIICVQPADLSQPPSITVSVSAKDSLFSGSQSASISAQTEIYLRN